MDLSIIIVSYNTRDLLDRCLTSVQESLKNADISYEILVLDNLSGDGSRELLNTKYKRVIKIFNKENLGFGRSNNLGIQRAKGKYVLLLNSDTKVLDQAIYKLYRFNLEHPEAFVGGKLYNEDGSPQASCGPMLTLPVVAMMLFFKGDQLHITRYSPRAITEVDWISGACIMAKKDAFLKAGLFDDKIFMYMEEIDLLYRAKQKGFGVLFFPSAPIIHTGAASSGSRKQPVINIYKGLVFFYQKHRSRPEQKILKFFLVLKANIAKILGILMRREDIVTTYEAALQVC